MTDFDNLEIRLEDINSSNPGIQRLYEIYLNFAGNYYWRHISLNDFCDRLHERICDDLEGQCTLGQYKEWLEFPEDFAIFLEDCGEEMY